MSEKIISFDRRKTRHSDLLKLHHNGYRVICPLCKSDIIFQKSGSWCSKNPNHYETHIYPADIAKKYRKEHKQWAKQESIANMKKKGYTEEQIRQHIAEYYPNVD